GAGARALDGYARELLASRVAKHLLQSAWIARRVYGPGGDPWRRYLVRSERARAVGGQWYPGDPIPLALRARLALDVAGALARGRPAGPARRPPRSPAEGRCPPRRWRSASERRCARPLGRLRRGAHLQDDRVPEPRRQGHTWRQRVHRGDESRPVVLRV